MKRFVLFIFSCFLLSLMLNTTLKAQINPNSGFEDATPGVHTGTEITGWDCQLGGTAAAVFEIVTDPDFVHTGNQALKVEVTAIGTNSWEPQVFNTEFPVTSNDTLLISVWAKSNVDRAIVHLTCGSLSPNYNEWGRLGGVELSTDWQQFSFQVVTRDPEAEPRGGIPIHFGAAENAVLLPIEFYLDDIVVLHPGQTVDVNDKPEVPAKFALAQNYPNPFNPTTNFEFQLADLGFVTLKVYNILGKEVATLVNETKQAGKYKIQFDASNIPSGVYFYTLTSNNFSVTKKLTVLK